MPFAGRLSKDVAEEGGVIRSYNRMEAVAYVRRFVIDEWKPKTDVIALKYSHLLASLAAAVPGFRLVNDFRVAHKMQKIRHGPAGVVAGIAGLISGGITFVFALNNITADVYLGITQCQLCVQTRAVCLQLGTGVALPFFLTAAGMHHQIVGLGFDKKIGAGVAGKLKWACRMLSRCQGTLAAHAAVQTALVSLLVYRMLAEWDNVTEVYDARMAAVK